MQWLLTFHGELRWLAALAAVIVAARSLGGWLFRSDFGKADRVLMSAMVGLLDLNLVLGLTLLFTLPGGFPAFRLEHAVTMLLAVAVAHSWLLWRKRDESIPKFRNNFVVALVVLLLLVVGVLRLRGGWTF